MKNSAAVICSALLIGCALWTNLNWPQRFLSAPAIRSLPTVTPTSQVGLASWYHSSGKTASGELLARGDFTAAHRTLPLGSRVRVTNLSNDKSVTVKISDRGPAVQSRIIDVSAAAARKLAMQQDGVVEVRIDVIDSGRLNNNS